MSFQWKKLGRILQPGNGPEWMQTFAGPSFAVPTDEDRAWVYVTGRDAENRSRIGRVLIDLSDQKILEVSPEPVLPLGDHGTFDENGTSYPWIVQDGQRQYMYYTGWVPMVKVPFSNDLGLAVSDDGGATFSRVSRAPVLPRTNSEPFGSGSVCVRKENDLWRMWYTCFEGWGTKPDEPKHWYRIKYAESNNGETWRRQEKVVIDFEAAGEYAIAKPSVIYHKEKYHMWYTYRGAEYDIGYAESPDGMTWRRVDDLAGITVSNEGWDSQALCYPHVFESRGKFYLLYNGNEYGRTGLGLAVQH